MYRPKRNAEYTESQIRGWPKAGRKLSSIGWKLAQQVRMNTDMTHKAKAVLSCLADHWTEYSPKCPQGRIVCWPSVKGAIIRETGLAERSVYRGLKELKDAGVIVITKYAAKTGDGNLYSPGVIPKATATQTVGYCHTDSRLLPQGQVATASQAYKRYNRKDTKNDTIGSPAEEETEIWDFGSPETEGNNEGPPNSMSSLGMSSEDLRRKTFITECTAEFGMSEDEAEHQWLLHGQYQSYRVPAKAEPALVLNDEDDF